jgi:hypothetical protein
MLHIVLLEKAGRGEGSRGGHVIGHTRSGKPVYANRDKNFRHPEQWYHVINKMYGDFTPKDHADAERLHRKLADKIEKEINKVADYSDLKAWKKEAQKRGFYNHSEQADEHYAAIRNAELKARQAKASVRKVHNAPPEHPDASKVEAQHRKHEIHHGESNRATNKKIPSHPRDLDNPKIFVASRPACSRAMDSMMRNNIPPGMDDNEYDAMTAYARKVISKLSPAVEKMLKKMPEKDYNGLVDSDEDEEPRVKRTYGSPARQLSSALNRVFNF